MLVESIGNKSNKLSLSAKSFFNFIPIINIIIFFLAKYVPMVKHLKAKFLYYHRSQYKTDVAHIDNNFVAGSYHLLIDIIDESVDN